MALVKEKCGKKDMVEVDETGASDAGVEYSDLEGIVTREEMEAAQERDAEELLVKAISDDDMRLVERALAMGANPTDEKLIRSVDAYSYHSMRVLLRAGANPNAVAGEVCLRMKRMTMLGCVAKRGDLQAVQELLAAGAHVDGHSVYCVTPLMLAALFDRIHCVNELIEAGADTNFVDMKGKSALLYGASYASPATLRMLVEAGANVNLTDSNGNTALMIACKKIWKRMFVPRRLTVDLLITAGADVNMVDAEQNTALLLLCACRPPQQNNYNMDIFNSIGKHVLSQLKQLLKAKADVNKIGHNGSTPLLNVSSVELPGMYGEEMVQVLLESGADVNAADSEGMTPLMNAVIYSIYGVVVVLLERGADVNAVNHMGYDAISQINEMTRGRQAVALIRGGADINELNRRSSSDIVKRECDIAKTLKLNLLHVCREVIRRCVMHNYPGEHVAKLTARLGLPTLLSEYVADVERYSTVL